MWSPALDHRSTWASERKGLAAVPLEVVAPALTYHVVAAALAGTIVLRIVTAAMPATMKWRRFIPGCCGTY